MKAILPLFGAGEASADGTVKAGSGAETRFEEIPINLELPQHVADLLQRVRSRKWIILENFHYLNDDIQKQFAFDLRAFQELGVRFVILGVWREKNRMAQFNGDLLDRVIEVPVEPWKKDDFRREVKAGAEHLSIVVADAIVEQAIESSFSSIGVFQELLKGGVRRVRYYRDSAETGRSQRPGNAHKDCPRQGQRLCSSTSAGARSRGRYTSGGAKGDLPPLVLPYYLVRVLLESGFDGIANGMRRKGPCKNKLFRGSLIRVR